MAPSRTSSMRRLFRGSDGDAISVATESGGDPEDVNVGYGGRSGYFAQWFSHWILLEPGL